MRILLSCLICLSLAGCGGLDLSFGGNGRKPRFADATPPEGTIRPRARPDGIGRDTPPENARTVEEFDTTSQVERQQAQTVSSGGKLLGEGTKFGKAVFGSGGGRGSGGGGGGGSSGGAGSSGGGDSGEVRALR